MPDIEQITPGIHVEWIENRRIALIQTPTHPIRSIQEPYYDYLCDLVRNWDTSRPLLMLFDAQHLDVFLTSYDRQRTQELGQIAYERKIRSRSAVIMKKSVFTQMISAFLLLINKHSYRQSRIRIFHEAQQGLTWLKDELEE